MTSSVTHCDCEKFGKDLANTATSPLSQKLTLKERPDDLFVNYHSRILAGVICISSIKITKQHSALASGFNSTIFQPPRL